MGGHPYWYFVPYQADLQAALNQLRDTEFRAGRYNPVVPLLRFDEAIFSSQTPGPKHRSIEEAVAAAGESGTRSILDIARIGSPGEYGVAAALPRNRLQELFGTDQPRRADLLGNDEYFDDIDRGQCILVVVYDRGVPSEIYFAGYSYD